MSSSAIASTFACPCAAFIFLTSWSSFSFEAGDVTGGEHRRREERARDSH